ncbi:hypothetical protein GCM10009630_41570 [Kribbella jejuensis]|uniref:hypothetical protein n=1 Tax=Kribbella jejuensis TaxID=236068 RepID=UPI001151C829|nr:hypothetical protein [Kribbella jejuensis]
MPIVVRQTTSHAPRQASNNTPSRNRSHTSRSSATTDHSTSRPATNRSPATSHDSISRRTRHTGTASRLGHISDPRRELTSWIQTTRARTAQTVRTQCTVKGRPVKRLSLNRTTIRHLRRRQLGRQRLLNPALSNDSTLHPRPLKVRLLRR